MFGTIEQQGTIERKGVVMSWRIGWNGKFRSSTAITWELEHKSVLSIRYIGTSYSDECWALYQAGMTGGGVVVAKSTPKRLGELVVEANRRACALGCPLVLSTESLKAKINSVCV